MNNIILIGMAGAGKSTLGVLIAKSLGLGFIDTDLIIQDMQKNLLQDIINEKGIDEFLRIEEKAICNMSVNNSVIATGGSVIYSPTAMQKLKDIGTIIYLNVPYKQIEDRVNNITSRGIVMPEGKSLLDIYNERTPLYEKYSDITIDCEKLEIEETVQSIIDRIAVKLDK